MTISGSRTFSRTAVFIGAGMLAAGALAACSSSSSSGGTAGSSASAGSGSSSSAAAGGAAASGGASRSVIYVSPVASQPGQADIFWAMQQAGKSLGWKVSQIDADLSPDKQVEGIDTAIDEQVSSIASWSLDPNTVAGAYLQARNADIPVVGVNSPSTDVATNVMWSENLCVKGGVQTQIAAYLAKLKPGGNIAMISGPPAATPPGIVQCQENDFTADGLKVVAQTSNSADSTQAANTIAANLLTAHPNINLIWCYNDSTALGTSAAVISDGKQVASSANPSSGIVIIGSNADKDALQAIQEHRLTATVDPNNIATGYAIIYQMEQLIDGKKTVPAITIPSILIDSSNVAKESNARSRNYTLSSFPGLPESS